jgi:RNA polymerase sigma-70 factor (ECF subfamily)
LPTDISQLLVRWSAGDESALQALTPMVYGELRRLGRSALRRGRADSILQPTVLVHEAWLRFSGKQNLAITNRGQFYGLAAKMIRDILVDTLRRRKAEKRGGTHISIELNDAGAVEQPRFVDFLALDEALTRLGEIGERYQRIVELRFITGLTIEETADVVNVSHATVEREWNFARAWLRRELTSHRELPSRLEEPANNRNRS